MNLVEALAREIWRVAEIIPRYQDLGAAALGSGEAVQCAAALDELKGWKL